MMCKEVEATQINTRRRQPPSPTKTMHLITDEGFGRRLAVNLAVMILIIAVCTANQPLHNYCLDIYYDMKEYMMRIANEMAWWSLLGLLSSSCCAIQMLLNTLSFGCAGFNNVLGPLRPTFLALAIVAQCSSWYVALTYSVVNDQWKVTSASTVLSVVLTLLPEVLAWRTTKRERIRYEASLASKHGHKVPNTNDSTNNGTELSREIKLQFQLSTMGCSSCVSTVSKVLDGIDGVLRHAVTLENGIAEIVLDEKVCGKMRRITSRECLTLHDLLWKDIADRLEASGFPVTVIECGPSNTSRRHTTPS